jgi:hypothetical protein
MNQIPIKLGPMALLFTVITICLTVLTLLTFSTARADNAMADRYAYSVHTRYALEKKGKAFLLEADNALADGKTLDSMEGVKKKKDIYQKHLTYRKYILNIRIKTKDGRCKVVEWKLSRQQQAKENRNHLWLG